MSQTKTKTEADMPPEHSTAPDTQQERAESVHNPTAAHNPTAHLPSTSGLPAAQRATDIATSTQGAPQRAQITTAMQRTAGNARTSTLLSGPTGIGLSTSPGRAPEQPSVQRSYDVGTTLDESVTRAIGERRGGGAPLPNGIRQDMEAAFGKDFSHVRVHNDAHAHELSRSVHARAFTVGNDIFFKNGTYDMSSTEGTKLLAHELTHVIQQDGASGTPTTVSEPNDASEHAADKAADQIFTRLDSAPVDKDTSMVQQPGEGREGALTQIPPAELNTSFPRRDNGGRGLRHKKTVNVKPAARAGMTFLQRDVEVPWDQPDDLGSYTGYALRPIAELWVQGRRQTTVDFNGYSRLTDNLDVPVGTRGIIQMRLQVQHFVVTGMRLFGSYRSTYSSDRYLAEWQVDANSDGLTLSFHHDQRLIRQDPLETITFDHAEQNNTLQITLSARREGPLRHPRELRQVVSLRVGQPPRARIGPIAVETILQVGPFAVGSARITPAMRSAVRRFYESLDESTRLAIQANERPVGRTIVIEGYASAPGSEEYNDDLATARATAVRDLLKQFSGNTQDDIFATPSFGEPRTRAASDVRGREVEDPRHRKAVIRLWQQVDSSTTVTTPAEP